MNGDYLRAYLLPILMGCAVVGSRSFTTTPVLGLPLARGYLISPRSGVIPITCSCLPACLPSPHQMVSLTYLPITIIIITIIAILPLYSPIYLVGRHQTYQADKKGISCTRTSCCFQPPPPAAAPAAAGWSTSDGQGQQQQQQ